MIEFLIVYLGLGIISEIGTLLSFNSNKPGLSGRLGLIFLSFSLWPVWTAYLLVGWWRYWRSSIRCPWCGESVNFHKAEEAKEHVKNCKEHPTLTEIARLNSIIEEYEAKEKYWKIEVKSFLGQVEIKSQFDQMQAENERLRSQVKELIGWGNLLADEYDSNNKHNHSSICPKGVLGSHQALEGECNCDYEKKYQRWRELVKRVQSGEVK